ncbi:bifunctional biotin--[acetyl-CoA-carboxylase] ligase/biotin operon repressor BirA [Pseudomonas petrae]|uniref:Bifunctional ligase/repressor BirA n=1 Tax=Pseudomonas petrae TaxID=2912190 RepID=A0ABS9ICF7_9PSED|nr:bifunctional biotin--[acetyl-CoA-carboxylase] ligase/biotin operon repressor BirA [Pseudomonas petrae]MCF7534530.1 bifunctional biotin--[acetyl-CoA-carboxylase] ligase/biotin operon repressor BirA [Pseudomonas petrae]MCF7539292.1 bifunctional biotin--[acetyl-CoA-carboxylase] ligase/biotin operon repressor BirA [Pseudomonas petrae]MCF7544773.1 bifunctional biotin--[acetyl-CoA-carboxylase] ligase/biotin operon repressor BirA [Pseudomonas petrae]MCF7558576.1 bifunctional biotin--[acetyl-CoA-car
MHTLLKLLEDGAFHSGEDLGIALGVSRSAVWKKLQQAQADLGIEIYKVRGRGYRLASPLSLLDDEALRREHIGLGWACRIHETIDSTNAEAMRVANSGAELPSLILSEQQTAGRGRRGRQWISPFAENLYYSLALRMDGGTRRLDGLSLLVGLAVVDTLRELGIRSAGLKWPNDILVGGKKLAGVLLELTGDPANVCHVVIGIGININMRESINVDQAWTSLALELGHVHDRNKVACALSRNLSAYLAGHQEKGFAAYRRDWEDKHLWQGLAVALTAGAKITRGIVMGVGDDGALRLDVGGREEYFSGGEVSLRLQGN